MKVLITGANGFLGNAIVSTLSDDQVISLSRTNATINCDLSKQIPTLPLCDMVIHAAGKAHVVPVTIEEKQEFFDINVTGTKNLLKGLEKLPVLPGSFLFISSVAVYGLEKGNDINEDHPLSATDPYGLSKIEAENIVKAWCTKNNVICTIFRLPLIVGANAPGNLKAMINGIKKGYYFNIDQGKAKKSMVLALDVANIIPIAAKTGGTYNLTDGHHPSFLELSGVIATQLNKPNPLNISLLAAKIIALVGDILGKRAPINSSKLSKITSDLTFDDTKARSILGWQPKAILADFKIN